jgi:hypothetical protein
MQNLGILRQLSLGDLADDGKRREEEKIMPCLMATSLRWRTHSARTNFVRDTVVIKDRQRSYWKLAWNILEECLHPISLTKSHPNSHATSYSVPLRMSHPTLKSPNYTHDLNLSPNLLTWLLIQHLKQAFTLTQPLTQLEWSILEACLHPTSYPTFNSPNLLSQPPKP